MENKFTPGKWELRGNKIFVSGTYNSIATIHIQRAWDKQGEAEIDVRKK